MKAIAYKMESSILEYVFGLIGPAIIIAAIIYPIPDLKIGSLWLRLPPGVANGVTMLVGVWVMYLTLASLVNKRAANSRGCSITLGDKSMTFTTVQKYRGELTTVDYDQLDKVVITNIPATNTSAEEKKVEISSPSMKPKKYEFDAIHMETQKDFDVLVDTLKRHAIKAEFQFI